jgi:hypothetical protein
MHVGAPHPIKRRSVGCRIVNRLALNRDGRVVHQNVEATKLANDFSDQAFRLGRITLISAKSRRLDSFGCSLPSDGLRLVCGGHITDGHIRSLLRQGESNGRSEAPGTSGDQRHLTLKFFVTHV